MIVRPTNRTLVLVDAGSMGFADGLTDYDDTPGGTPTPSPTPTLSMSSPVSAAEGNSGTKAFTFTATLDRKGLTTVYPYSWQVAGIGSNPTDPADFGGSFPSGSGSFGANETQKTVTVLVSGDTAIEPDEKFRLTFTIDGVGAATVDGTIVNDDSAPGLQPLSVAPNTGQVGTFFTGTINGKTSGSALAISGPGAAGMSISGTTLSGTPTSSGSIDIVETLNGTSRTSGGVVTVAAAPTSVALNMTQLPANKLFQRSTRTGGGINKGTGTVPVQINHGSSTPVAVYARTQLADGTILQPSFLVSNAVPSGQRTLNITGVDARRGKQRLALSTNNVDWQVGTTDFHVGINFYIDGQSLAVDMTVPLHGDGSSAASLGITADPATTTYVGWVDVNNTYHPPAWRPWVDQTASDQYPCSAGGIRLANGVIEREGVSVAIVSDCLGNTSIYSHVGSGVVGQRQKALFQEVVGFEYHFLMVGHSDASGGSSGQRFKAGLAANMWFTTSNNALGLDHTAIYWAVPNTGQPNDWGTPENKNKIRRAMIEFKARDGQSLRKAYYCNNYGLDVVDTAHCSQTGNKQIADTILAAINQNADQFAGDDAIAPLAKINPTMSGSPVYTAAGRFTGGSFGGNAWAHFNGDFEPGNGGIASFAMWVYVSGDTQGIMGLANNLYAFIRGGRQLNFQPGDGEVECINGTSPIAVGWHFVNFEFDNIVSKLTFFVDGVVAFSRAQDVSSSVQQGKMLKHYNGGFQSNLLISEYRVSMKPIGAAVPTAAMTGNELYHAQIVPFIANANALI